MKDFPTAEELEALFREGKMERIGMGSRRACYKSPGTEFCVKCYRSDDEIEEGMYNGSKELSPSVVREIKRSRFDEKRNTCCQEYRYWKKLRKKLPAELFAVFPCIVEQRFVSSRGWCIVEERIMNADGSSPLHFSHFFRSSNNKIKAQLLHALKKLLVRFVSHSIRLYDPQNIVVQKLQGGNFKLRLMDFEPSTRCLIPIDAVLPFYIRSKSFRRARRWMREHLGVKVGAWYRFVKAQHIIEKWDNLIETEGAAMGLSDCKVFLENKLVNDIFYEGLYKGVPCVVKCSSRAPESIFNEYRINGKLFAADEDVFPKVLAYSETSDARFAFVVTRKITGPSLNELLLDSKGITPTQADSFAVDMLKISEALRRVGIVHRDINQDNLLVDCDGHLKLVDFQFAVNRDNYRESAYMRRNWKYLYVLFAFSRPLGGATWNDMRALKLRAQMMPQTHIVKNAVAFLESKESGAVFSISVPMLVRVKLRLYKASLRLQLLFRQTSAKRAVIEKRIDLVDILLAKKD